MRARVSERGQVVIPKSLRDLLGIEPGAVLDFDVEQGRLVATKTAGDDPVSRVWGILRSDASGDATVRALRGEPDACDPA